MEFEIEKDAQNRLKFYAEPIDRAAIAEDLLAGALARKDAGASASESASGVRAEIAKRTVQAFGETSACAWLGKYAQGKYNLDMDFSVHSGLIPMPRILITFTDNDLAFRFKLQFGATVTEADGGEE